MTRLIFPDEGSRLVYDPLTGRPSPSASVRLYVDDQASQPADLRTIGGSTLTVPAQVATDAFGKIVLFQGPDDLTDTLYAIVNGGPITPVYARADDRIDALSTRVATLETATGTTSSGLSAETAARQAADAAELSARAAADSAEAALRASGDSNEVSTRAAADAAEIAARAAADAAEAATRAAAETSETNARVAAVAAEASARVAADAAHDAAIVALQLLPLVAHYTGSAWVVPTAPHPWLWIVGPGDPQPTSGVGLAVNDIVVDTQLTDPHGSATRAETVRSAGVGTTMVTQTGFGCLFVPERSITVSKLWCMTSASVTAGGATPLFKIGLFTVAANGDITLVARTAHDATLVNTANTDKSSPLATAGGFPSTYSLSRGTTYALMFLPVFTTGALSMRGDYGPFNVNPMAGFTIPSLADIPTGTTAVGSLVRGGARLWLAAEV